MEIKNLDQAAISAVDRVSIRDCVEGFEEMTAESFTIPFLNIAQSLSPALKEKSSDSLLKEGDIFDSASLEVFQKVRVIPVLFRRRFLEWKPRTMGGGFVGIHVECPHDAVRGEKGLLLKNGNSVNDTRQHYVLYEDSSGAWVPALITFKSTSIKVSQTWCLQMARAREVIKKENTEPVFKRLNMYDRMYELTTKLRHDKGYSWFEFVVRPLKEAPPLFALQEAKNFYNSLRTEKVDVEESYSQEYPDYKADVEESYSQDYPGSEKYVSF